MLWEHHHLFACTILQYPAPHYNLEDDPPSDWEVASEDEPEVIPVDEELSSFAVAVVEEPPTDIEREAGGDDIVNTINLIADTTSQS